MKHKPFFRPILWESWQLTWRHKGWWLISLLALLVTSSIGYQFILQSYASLVNPDMWMQRWQNWAELGLPFGFISSQFNVLGSDPKGWLIMIFVWAMIIIVLAILFSISIYAMSMIIAAIRFRNKAGRFSMLATMREAWVHFKSVFAAIILALIVSNALLLIFSLPIVWLGLGNLGFASIIGLIIVFALFGIISFLIAILTIYTLLYIILEDLSLSSAIVAAWRLFKNYWLISLEMLLLQFLIIALIVGLVTLLISVLVVTIVVFGIVLLANQQVDIMASVPIVMLYLIGILYLILGSVYTMFNLLSWSLMFVGLEKAKPNSRLTQFAEAKFGVK